MATTQEATLQAIALQKIANNPHYQGFSAADKAAYLEQEVIHHLYPDILELEPAERRQYVREHIMPVMAGYVQRSAPSVKQSASPVQQAAPTQMGGQGKSPEQMYLDRVNPAASLNPMSPFAYGSTPEQMENNNAGAAKGFADMIKGASLRYIDANPLVQNLYPKQYAQYVKHPELNNIPENVGSMVPMYLLDIPLSKIPFKGAGVLRAAQRGAVDFGTYEATKRREGVPLFSTQQLDPLGRMIDAGKGAAVGGALGAGGHYLEQTLPWMTRLARDQIAGTREALSPNTLVGHVSYDTAQAIGKPAGEVHLEKGNQDYGEAHIAKDPKKLANFKKLFGIHNIRDFVRYVGENYNQIWFQPSNGRFLFAKTNGKAAVAVVEFRLEKNGYYSVTTAYTPNKTALPHGGRILVWERSEPLPNQTGSPDSDFALPAESPVRAQPDQQATGARSQTNNHDHSTGGKGSQAAGTREDTSNADSKTPD